MSNYKKNIAILGSTGSIGTQALEVIESQSDFFQIEVLTANENSVLLVEQAIKHRPNAVVIVNESKFNFVNCALKPYGITVFAGEKSLEQIVEMDSIDLVLNALVGYSGLRPTIRAIEFKKDIALANKEVLVVAGQLIMSLVKESSINLFPVDSEHSAIFQCLVGEGCNPVEKVVLTASGGPFRGFSLSQLSSVSKKEALKHPNWSMGQKITIDSASLMNKGLEVIEAKWLFGLKNNQIDVIVHPESIIHSMVVFEDGSMKAQMGLPDMKIPIQYALGFPKRLKTTDVRFDFSAYPSLNFEKPNLEVFKCLGLAYEVLKIGGNAACILNAANEIAVEAFLKDKIEFLKIPEIITSCIEKATFVAAPKYDDYVNTNIEARQIAKEFI